MASEWLSPASLATTLGCSSAQPWPSTTSQKDWRYGKICVGLCGRMLMPRVRFTDLLGIDSTRGVTARGCALGGGIEFATTIDGAACLRICAGALAVVVVYPSWCVVSPHATLLDRSSSRYFRAALVSLPERWCMLLSLSCSQRPLKSFVGQ